MPYLAHTIRRRKLFSLGRWAERCFGPSSWGKGLRGGGCYFLLFVGPWRQFGAMYWANLKGNYCTFFTERTKNKSFSSLKGGGEHTLAPPHF